MTLYWIWLVLAAAFNAGSSLVFQAAAGHQGPSGWLGVVAGLGLATVNTVFYTRALEGVGASAAYPILAGLTVVFLLGSVWLTSGVRPSLTAGAGVLAILGGITLVLR